MDEPDPAAEPIADPADTGELADPDGRLPFGVRLLIAALFATSMANRAQLVALGLLVFDITGEELDLGLLGLAEFLPIFLLAPFTGTMADRYDRRIVAAVGLIIELAVAAGLFLVARGEPTSITPVLALVLVFGVARAITTPASRALPIDLAPPGLVERVVALRSVAFQSAGIVGPLIAGLLFAVDRSLPFLLSFVGFSVAIGFLAFVPATGVRQLTSQAGPGQAIRDAIEGLRYMRRTPVLLGAITLDLFAVLFGGAVALLPAIGEKRLGVDEAAVGFLYSAIGVGALITAAILSVRPVRRHIGLVLFGVVSVFGLATIVLGLTTSYAVALVALIVLSAADAVSVFIRATIVPLATPEEMRGRVLAVESVFIGGSNELGALESGLTAAWFGLVTAVVLGGFGTLAVVGVSMLAFPALRKVDRFEDVRPVPVDADP
ncbi:MAG: MFS transporter [Actinomycetota bacterium]